MIAIPGMLGLYDFVVACRRFFTHQTIVFDVVNGFQENSTDQGCKPKREISPSAKQEVDGQKNGKLYELEAQHFVAPRPR